MNSPIALVVDDSNTALAVLSRMLKKLNLSVDTATSGEAALDYLSTQLPDIIFLDHIMPGMDGFAVLRLLQSDSRTRSIPVVMYTSQKEIKYVEAAKQMGAVDVVNKQVTGKVLSRVISHVLPNAWPGGVVTSDEILDLVNVEVEVAEADSTTLAISRGKTLESDCAVHSTKVAEREIRFDPADSPPRLSTTFSDGRNDIDHYLRQQSEAAASLHRKTLQQLVEFQSDVSNTLRQKDKSFRMVVSFIGVVIALATAVNLGFYWEVKSQREQLSQLVSTRNDVTPSIPGEPTVVSEANGKDSTFLEEHLLVNPPGIVENDTTSTAFQELSTFNVSEPSLEIEEEEEFDEVALTEIFVNEPVEEDYHYIEPDVDAERNPDSPSDRITFSDALSVDEDSDGDDYYDDRY